MCCRFILDFKTVDYKYNNDYIQPITLKDKMKSKLTFCPICSDYKYVTTPILYKSDGQTEYYAVQHIKDEPA